jgi:hypothetical protein
MEEIEIIAPNHRGMAHCAQKIESGTWRLRRQAR